eukprot:JP436197.1.p9 GENE.JP436197.1~~JP436197.1.p9  ORF type:complete len:51 (+),score=1.99 JP436197.1:408-560(+)
MVLLPSIAWLEYYSCLRHDFCSLFVFPFAYVAVCASSMGCLVSDHAVVCV